MPVEEAMKEFGAIMECVYRRDLDPKERTERLRLYVESLLVKKDFSPELKLEAEGQDECLGSAQSFTIYIFTLTHAPQLSSGHAQGKPNR